MALGFKSGFSLVKSGFICCGVPWAALTLKLMAPVLTELASFTVLCIQTCVKPPYLYLLVNFIILAVVASSRFQQAAINHQNSYKAQYSVPLTPAAAYTPAYPVPQEAAIYNHQMMESRHVMDEAVVIGTPLPMHMVVYEEQIIGETRSTGVPTEKNVNYLTNQTPIDDEEDKFFVSSRKRVTDEPEIVPEKPLISTRKLHRKISKSMSDDRRVQKQNTAAPKQSNPPTETLESAWRKITEARQMNKSDTWSTQTRPINSDDDGQQRMSSFKSVFDPRLSASARSIRVDGVDLGRAVSPSQDELNRRIEAFIRQFNEETRYSSVN